jgi:WD40 repeat protein
LQAHTSSISIISITKDDSYAISGGKDYSIIVWNLKAKNKEAVLKGHDDGI